jgi:ferredoxin
MQLKDIDEAVRAVGLTPRGAFRPTAGDRVPHVAPSLPARTLVLVGNAGPAMWAAFCSARDPSRDRLDEWCREVLTALAGRLGAAVFFPFDHPPLPFQRWAQRAEPCHLSPLRILIHPRYGLWHGYRGALAFAERLKLRPHDRQPSPCESCLEKPCLTACPVSAYTAERYDVPACAEHISSAEGADCLEQGCRARRACPVGRDYRYALAQARFHMAAYLRAVRRAA